MQTLEPNSLGLVPPPLPICVSLGKLLPLSEPVSSLGSGDINTCPPLAGGKQSRVDFVPCVVHEDHGVVHDLCPQLFPG